MCGRYVLAIPADEIADAFRATFTPDAAERYLPSYNIPPTTPVLALSEDPRGDRVLDLYRWGLLPPWTKSPSSGPTMHNARAETIATKPSFRSAFRSRRVAIVAQGYFEWRRTPGAALEPFYISRADGAPLAFAGIWESWVGDGREVRSTAVVTTAAGADTEGIHDRMPVVLEPDVLDLWLDPDEVDRDTLASVLHPATAGTLRAWAVDPRVGKVRENDPEVIVPLTSESPTRDRGVETPTLFDTRSI
jgi:putative SOS response-associated peptidase YedK